MKKIVERNSRGIGTGSLRMEATRAVLMIGGGESEEERR